MTYAVVYSSKTGNTKLLAETIRWELPSENCIYYGEPDSRALAADRIYLGFWTDRGRCCKPAAAFLKTLSDQELFLFGTAGFGGNPAYFQKILQRTLRVISKDVRLIGSFLCQGRMPLTVRDRYTRMQHRPLRIPNLQAMIENFDQAMTHPDQADLDRLKAAIAQLPDAGPCPDSSRT